VPRGFRPGRYADLLLAGNVEAIRRHGVQVSAANDAEPRSIKASAVHVTEVQHFYGNPFDLAFIATKCYDTKWATMLISDYVAPSGVYVSLQNCINEDQIAGIVGWERAMGCVVSHGIGGELYEPGRIRMGYHLTNRDLTSFYVGEVHGRITARARRLAEMLDVIGPAVATPDLWGERWSKLCVNGVRNGVSAATGMYGNERDADQDVRRFCIQLGGKAVRVAEALGHEIDKVGNVDAEALASAGETPRR
jgi:2-dehydropantoate 2-reductase